jgi:hypothetical protein
MKAGQACFKNQSATWLWTTSRRGSRLTFFFDPEADVDEERDRLRAYSLLSSFFVLLSGFLTSSFFCSTFLLWIDLAFCATGLVCDGVSDGHILHHHNVDD